MDIHNYKRQLERQIELVNLDENISEVNKKLIIDFKNFLFSYGIGVAKIGRYLLDLRKLALMLNKPFSDANRKDLMDIVAQIEQGELSSESKKSFKILLRKLYRYIRGIDEKGVYPEEVRWISIAVPKNQKKLPEELLTEQEIFSIITQAQRVRDRAFFSILSESGARISEIGTMKIKHLSFEEHGTRLTISGKTGTRKILVIRSTPYLQQWLNDHPLRDEPDSYLWCTSVGNPISYTRLAALLKEAAKRAGIKKRIYPHLFRHSRATALASKMTESAMKQYLGWGQDSKMAGVYIHMSGRDTDEAILAVNGIEIEKKKVNSVLNLSLCERCKTKNGATDKFCKNCGFVLDNEEATNIIKKDGERKKADEIMDMLIQDPEIWGLIKKKLAS